MFMGQFHECEKLVILPLESLHKLAADLGDPEGADKDVSLQKIGGRKVTLIHMTARCGSTLLAQVK